MEALLRQDNKTIKLLNHWIQINTDEILRDFFLNLSILIHIFWWRSCPVLADYSGSGNPPVLVPNS